MGGSEKSRTLTGRGDPAVITLPPVPPLVPSGFDAEPSLVSALHARLALLFAPAVLQAFKVGTSPWFRLAERMLLRHDVEQADVDLLFAPGRLVHEGHSQDEPWFQLALTQLRQDRLDPGVLVAVDVSAPVPALTGHQSSRLAPEFRTDVPAVDASADARADVSAVTLMKGSEPADALNGGIAPDASAPATPTAVEPWQRLMLDDAAGFAMSLATAPRSTISPAQEQHLKRMNRSRMARHKSTKDPKEDASSFVIESAGHSVQIIRTEHGIYHRRHYMLVPDAKTGDMRRKPLQRSLGTKDIAVARLRAEAFLLSVVRELKGLTASARPVEPLSPHLGGCEEGGRVRVADAITAYVTSKAFMRLGAHTRCTYRSALAALAATIGYDREFESVSEEDLEGHSTARLAPGLRYRALDVHGHWGRVDKVKKTPVKPETVNADFTTFAILWNWCAKTPDKNGELLVRLTRMPTVRRHAEDDKRRPTADIKRLDTLARCASDQLVRVQKAILQEESDGVGISKHRRQALRRTLFLRVALALAGLYGQRVGDIARLLWDDVDLEGHQSDDGPSITFRQKNTRGGPPKSHLMRIAPETLEDLRALLESIGSRGLSPYVFPQYTDFREHVSGDEFGKWLNALTDEAGVRRLEGGIWHPFRRGWSIHLLDAGWDSQKVASLGGWRDFATFHRCYALNLPSSQRVMLATAPMAEILIGASKGASHDSAYPRLQVHDGGQRGQSAGPTKRSTLTGVTPRSNVPQSRGSAE